MHEARNNTMESSKISITAAPDLQYPFDILFSQDACNFLVELVTTFEKNTDELQWNRLHRKCQLGHNIELPTFNNTPRRCDPTWKVEPVPKRLLNRRLDLGDVSPANTTHFIKALNANVQGIQVDFDDGHCPTWRNQIIGHYNVYQVVHEQLANVKKLAELPILMLRPRAWNMIEHNILINGKEAPGPLIDFGILMFHNASILSKTSSGPFFYLSKLEGANEAKLWNDVFVWTQNKLNIPHGTIKACVLIENILSSFDMEDILYNLKDHSLGLNCGIWDYAASIICKFGDHKDFILPDRNKYVNMEKRFLKKYMQLVVQTCHRRGAYATGGMAALLIPKTGSANLVIQRVLQAKRMEILAGVDGFMVYDLKLVPYINKLWNEICGSNVNQLNVYLNEIVTEADLLQMPIGGVTFEGLQHNIEVAILFIYNWFKGNGHFFYKGAVEDSATAEISRSQIWQWIRHKATIEDSGEVITKMMVQTLTKAYVGKHKHDILLHLAAELFMDIVTARYFPDFITSYLNDNYMFRHNYIQNKQNKFNPKL